MPDLTGEVVEQTEAQRQAEEREGEAAFAAGVANVRGKDETEVKTPGATEKTDEVKTVDADAKAAAQATADAKAKAEAEAKAAADAADPWKNVPPVVREEFNKLNTSVTSQLRNLAGHIGSFKQQVEKMTTTAQAAAVDKNAPVPTKLEITEALTDPEKWKQLQEDFPEWMQPIFGEMSRLRKDMAAVAKAAEAKPAPAPAPAPVAAAAPQRIDEAAIVSQAEERAYVRMKHPDWKAICADPKFNAEWLPKQSEAVKAQAASDSAEDAIAVFDAYKAHLKAIADAKAKVEKNEKRLQGAVPAEGSAEPPAAGISDDDAFNVGVKRTLKRGG